MTRPAATVGLAALAWCSTACSAQVGLGAAPTQVPSGAHPTIVTTSLQAEPGAGSGSVIGVRTTAIRESGIALRSAALAAGYVFRIPIERRTGVPPLSFETTIDLGGGMPAFRRFEGAGVYAGISAGFRMRIAGDDDEHEYHVLLPLLDVVLVSHQGLWMPPEGGPTRTLYGEWQTLLAVRLSLHSSLVLVRLPTVTPSEGR